MERETRTMDQIGCARCHGEGHPQITFTAFTHPVELDDGTAFTFWAPCPTNGEPILLMVVPAVSDGAA